MAHVFLRAPAPSSTLQQEVLITLALAVFALFLPTLLVVRAAREALEEGHSLEQEHASKKLPLLLPAGASVKTAKRKKKKVRKNGKTIVGRHCGQDGLADSGRHGPSDSDDIGAALEAAWSGSEAVDATLKTRPGSFGATGGQPMAAALLSASASQIELKEAEINELPGVAEHQQSDERHAEVQRTWQPSAWCDSSTQQLATEIGQNTQTATILDLPPGLLLLQKAELQCEPEQAQTATVLERLPGLLLLEETEPQCEPKQAAKHGAEWGCVAERRYGRMVFLAHRKIRAETLQRCPPGLGLASQAAMTQESTLLKGLSTRSLTLWP